MGSKGSHKCWLSVYPSHHSMFLYVAPPLLSFGKNHLQVSENVSLVLSFPHLAFCRQTEYRYAHGPCYRQNLLQVSHVVIALLHSLCDERYCQHRQSIHTYASHCRWHLFEPTKSVSCPTHKGAIWAFPSGEDTHIAFFKILMPPQTGRRNGQVGRKQVPHWHKDSAFSVHNGKKQSDKKHDHCFYVNFMLNRKT